MSSFGQSDRFCWEKCQQCGALCDRQPAHLGFHICGTCIREAMRLLAGRK